MSFKEIAIAIRSRHWWFVRNTKLSISYEIAAIPKSN